jgi:hypothetical protein
MKDIIRNPDSIQVVLANTELMGFIVTYNEKIMAASKLPSFFFTLAKFFFKLTPFGSIFEALYSEAKKVQKK